MRRAFFNFMEISSKGHRWSSCVLLPRCLSLISRGSSIFQFSHSPNRYLAHSKLFTSVRNSSTRFVTTCVEKQKMIDCQPFCMSQITTRYIFRHIGETPMVITSLKNCSVLILAPRTIWLFQLATTSPSAPRVMFTVLYCY